MNVISGTLSENKESEISHQLKYLEESNLLLENIINDLSERLRPVCSSKPMTEELTKDGDIKSLKSQVADSIERQANFINKRIKDLKYIISSLEV